MYIEQQKKHEENSHCKKNANNSNTMKTLFKKLNKEIKQKQNKTTTNEPNIKIMFTQN